MTKYAVVVDMKYTTVHEVSKEHVAGLEATIKVCRRYEDIVFLQFLLRKAKGE